MVGFVGRYLESEHDSRWLQMAPDGSMSSCLSEHVLPSPSSVEKLQNLGNTRTLHQFTGGVRLLHRHGETGSREGQATRRSPPGRSFPPHQKVGRIVSIVSWTGLLGWFLLQVFGLDESCNLHASTANDTHKVQVFQPLSTN